MAWSPQQEQALRDIRRWLDTPGDQIFRLFGFAGTGKTTLAKAIAENVGGEVIFAAFTGKAALVLRGKGCDDARTIHSLIYKLDREDVTGELYWRIDRDSEARDASLIIIDECSMVDEALGRDLLSFGTKVLVLGDPMQLPPVSGGEGYFTKGEPDYLLTEIHRQAQDNPIIHMSMIVREGGFLRPGTYGDSLVISPEDQIETDRVLAADQVLVGTNKRRLKTNDVYRNVTKRTGAIPCSGEKLVCLRNKSERGLLNGGLWTVDTIDHFDPKKGIVAMRLNSEDDDKQVKVRVPAAFFRGEEDKLDWVTKKYNDQFTYGYALTVHKAQGSQWDDVVIIDESPVFRQDRAKHLYTALTRAAEKVVVRL